jgi:hypothetical protein
MRRPFIASIVAATLLGSISDSSAAVPDESGWEIGPIIRGKNYSQGMPLRPSRSPGGWAFDFPTPNADAGHVHYVTFRPGSLVGKSRLLIRYRVDARRGTRFVPQESPDKPATVSVYIQQRGDNWSAKGRYEYYRWFAPARTVRILAPGEQEVEVRLDDPNWVSVLGGTSSLVPGRMQAALADVDRIGLLFGSAGGRGHGVYATAPARFTLLSFRIL